MNRSALVLLCGAVAGHLGAQWPVTDVRGKASLRVLVRKPDGKPAHHYELRLLGYSGIHLTRIGRPAASVQKSTEGYEFANLPAGRYVVVATAPGFARSLSEAVTLKGKTGEELELVFRLVEGGRMTGRVVDVKGEPIADVVVTTARAESEDPLARAWASLIAPRTSEVTVKTGKDGRFAMDRLAPGTYQLRFEHPEYLKVVQNGVKVENRNVHDAGTVKLSPGAPVSGTVLCDGKPVVGAAVSVYGINPAMRHFTALTGRSGKFAIPQCLGPGTYQIYAHRLPVQSPFDYLEEINETTRQFEIKAIQPYRVGLNLPK